MVRQMAIVSKICSNINLIFTIHSISITSQLCFTMTNLYYYRRRARARARACVCVFAKFDQFLPVRSHFDTKRPVNFFHIATFPSPTFGPLFAFHCPLFFTKNNNFECRDVLKTVTVTCVCVCKIWQISDQFLPLRSHFDTKRPVNLFHIATFPSPTFGPLFAFHCPLFFTKNNNLECRDVLKMVTVTTQDRPLNCKQQQPLTSVVQWYSARLRS